MPPAITNYECYEVPPRWCFVKLETSDGLVGWGEPIVEGRSKTVRAAVEELLDGYLLGEDPGRIEHHWQRMYRGGFYRGGPILTSAIAGIDQALWDLKGKRLGVSVARLLGGQDRSAVRAYATGHFWPDVDSFEGIRESVVAEAAGHVDAGFDALKNKIGFGRHPDFPWGWREDVELVRAIREAVGDDVRLMTDANHAYDLATASRVGQKLADLDVYWLEEPVRPHAKENYAHLNETLDVPLAGGECWAFEHEFSRVLDLDGVGVTQPDVTSAGGLTSTRRVATLSDSHNVQCVPHVFGSAVALAASLQVLATIGGDPMLEFDRTPNPIREDLAVDPITNEGNSVSIPDAPGIGVEIDPDVLASFRTD